MESFFIYLLKVNVLLLLVLAFYRLLLKKETFFTGIRYYFLAGIGLSMVLPLLAYTQVIYVPFVASGDKVAITLENDFSKLLMEEQGIISRANIVTVIYLIIAAIGLVLLGRKIYQLVCYIRGLQPWSVDGSIRLGRKEEEAYSFWKWMVLPKNFPEVNYAELLVAHERIHLKQYHTIDVIIVQVLRKVFWFNPLLKELERCIHLNLEHIVDAEVSESTDLYGYQMALVNVQQQFNVDTTLVNSFYASALKRRIIMLNQPKSKNMNRVKFILPLPVIAGLFFVFQVKVEAKTLNEASKQEVFQDTSSFLNDKENFVITSEEEQSIITSPGQVPIVISDQELHDKVLATALEVDKDAQDIIAGAAVALRDSEERQARIASEMTARRVNLNEKKEEVEAKREILLKEINARKKKQEEISKEIEAKREIFLKEINARKKKQEEISKEIEAKRNELVEEHKAKVAGQSALLKERQSERKQTLEKSKKQRQNHKGKTTEIIIVNNSDEDGSSGSKSTVFITKDKEGSGKTVTVQGLGKSSSSKITNINVDSESNDKDIIYFINGKEVGIEEVKGLDTSLIESMSVFKGSHAVKKYGKRANKGAIEITMK